MGTMTLSLFGMQEVEGIRTDVRVVNLSLFNTDWYIDCKMKRAAYESAPIPGKMRKTNTYKEQEIIYLFLKETTINT